MHSAARPDSSAAGAGAATIRFQASPVDPLTFFDVKASVQVRKVCHFCQVLCQVKCCFPDLTSFMPASSITLLASLVLGCLSDKATVLCERQ